MAKSLWFQQRYVEPILAGEKRTTIRKPSCRILEGDVVAASVGPRQPFAQLRITRRSVIHPSAIADPEHQQAVAALYPDAESLVELHFELLT